MLASALDAREAATALAAGADIIDMKDARHGALGALPLDVIAQAVAAVAGRRPVSATLGDPPYDIEALVARARALRGLCVRYVKFAVDADFLARHAESLAALARDVDLIGMQFADDGLDVALLPRLAALGFAGAMIDTRDKARGRLTTLCDGATLAAFCARCRAAGLRAGLAGSLRADDVPALLAIRPDVLGFRGALCADHARGRALDAAATRALRSLIPTHASDRASAKA